MVTSIILRKDRKIICAVKCVDPPFELPQELNITSLVSIKTTFGLSKFPKFSLTPAPDNSHQQKEWGLFLNFLHKHDRAAVIEFQQYKFSILPPSVASEFSTVNVAYQIDNTCSVDTRPRDCESGSHLVECGGPITIKFPPQAEDHAHLFTAETGNEFQSRLPVKNCIRVDPSYLKTLSQAHSGWIFGGIAELVDNSRDAKATKMDIFIDMIKLKKSGKDVPMLSVIDDGHGMSHEEIMKMVSFGHKQSDKEDKDHIGKFGVGFKTGAMRLGRDVLVLTQRANSRSLAFLSQSLNEGKDNIEIPVVSYRRQGQHMEVDLRTQIYIWNLDEWGSKYCLEWHDGLKGGSSFHQGDILISSKRTRSRPGQISQHVPLDYSLRAYLEVIFLVPRMKISVQGTLVKSRPLANFLTQTVIETGNILGKPVELILGFSQLEWERANSGMFLYWHGRLIEDEQDGRVWVHNNKQGFQDSEPYAHLEQWLGRKADKYWDDNFDSLTLDRDNCISKPDREWVQCDKCRKWRILPSDFQSRKLPQQWFCYMEPLKGRCADAELKMKPGIVNISTKRSGYDCLLKDSDNENMKVIMETSDDKLLNIEDVKFPALKRLRKGTRR